MNELLVGAALVAGLALGAVVMWALLRGKTAATDERLAAQRSALQMLEQREGQLQSELAALRTANTVLERDKAGLAATLDQEREQTREKLALIEQAERKLVNVFESTAAKALNSNNQSFLDLAKTAFATEQETAKGDLEKRQQAIDALVNPVKEALTKVDTTIQAIELAREGAYSELRTQVQTLQVTGQQIRAETATLANALRSSNVVGDWGQMQLRQVVKMAGMIDHCDFVEQFTTDQGSRPDLVVHLPGDRRIAVDAKVPLSALLDAANSADEESRSTYLKDYSRRLKKHVDELGRKEYWKQFEQSPDFVVLFLPGETFFHVAQEQEPELIAMAWTHRVVIATPSTLIALLRAVASYWQQEKLAESAHEIRNLGNKLYEALAGLAEKFVALGKNLKSSVNCYNDAVSRLENSVFVGARKFSELGATSPSEKIDELQPLEVDIREIRREELLLEQLVGENGFESHS
jgi:DNA recombination protein RmuC